jgi:tripartite ATP-independent transporter DctP family solute receptor
MRKLLVVLLIALFSLSLFAAGEGEAADTSKAQYTIKFATGDPPDVLTASAHADAVMFKNYVEARSGGRIKVEIYPANELGSEREQLEGVHLGSIHMCNVSEGTVGIFFPDIIALSVPYAFRTYTEAWAVADSPFMKNLMGEMVKDTGIRCLDVNQNGFRHFSNNIRPVRNPADMKGLKIRTMEHRGHMAMVNELGANAVPIAWGELYSALQQKVVDGQENPPSLVQAMKFYEVQKYYTLDGHIYSIDFTFINNRFYNSLPADLRQIVYEGADISGTIHKSLETYVSNVTAVGALMEEGMEVYTPSAEEIAQFQEATQGPVMDWINNEIDPKWVSDFMSTIDTVKKGLVAPSGTEPGNGFVIQQ